MAKPTVLGTRDHSLSLQDIPEDTRLSIADDLVTTHQHLCRRGARKFWRTGLERCDLEQVAAIGLIKASRRYNPESATPFEAYAWLVIVGELMHHVRDHELAVRIPRRLRTLEPQFNRALETCAAELFREPNETEIAARMGILPREVTELKRVRAIGATLQLEDPAARSVAISNPVELEDRVIVRDALAALSMLERRVVVGVYLLGFTQLELGRTLGLTARYVSTVRLAALQRMQRAWAS